MRDITYKIFSIILLFLKASISNFLSEANLYLGLNQNERFEGLSHTL